MIKITNLSKSYHSAKEDVTVLSNVSLSLPSKGLVFILGRSGSGKSTLLNLLGGLIGEYTGSIIVGNSNLAAFSENDWCDFRSSHFGIVFQDYSLFEQESVVDNVLLPTLITKVPPQEAMTYAHELLQYVGLEERFNSPVSELSGGEKQRIAIARALINSPEILLADEPTGNLDEETSSIILGLFRRISEERLVLIVTHDADSARRYGDVVYSLKNGNLLVDSSWNAEDCRLDNSSASHVSTREKSPRRALPWRTSFRRAWLNIRSHTFKKLFGSIALSVLLLFLFVAINLYNYNTAKVSETFYNRYQPDFLILETTRSYETPFLDTVERTLSAGPVYRRLVTQAIPNLEQVPARKTSVSLGDYPNGETFSAVIISDSALPQRNALTGSLPQDPSDVILTDALVTQLKIRQETTPTTVSFDNSLFNLSGVLATGFADYYQRFIPKEQYAENQLFRALYDFNRIFISSNYEDYQKANTSSLLVEHCSFEHLNALSEFLFSETVIKPVDNNCYYLYCGKYPSADNELLVSESVADKLSPGWESKVWSDITGHLPSIHESLYNDVYSDCLDPADMFPNGFNVVGVFGGDGSADVLVTSAKFQTLLELYHDTGYWNLSYTLTNDTITEKTFQKIDSVGLVWNEPHADKIREMKTTLIRLKWYLCLGCIISILGIFSIAMLLISQSIRSQAYMLGVMRTVGYSKADLSKIYFCETLITVAFSVVIALTALFSIQRYANTDYAQAFADQPFDIFVFGCGITTLTILGTITLCIISVAFPIFSLTRKRPFDLIHSHSEH